MDRAETQAVAVYAVTQGFGYAVIVDEPDDLETWTDGGQDGLTHLIAQTDEEAVFARDIDDPDEADCIVSCYRRDALVDMLRMLLYEVSDSYVQNTAFYLR